MIGLIVVDLDLSTSVSPPVVTTCTKTHLWACVDFESAALIGQPSHRPIRAFGTMYRILAGDSLDHKAKDLLLTDFVLESL